MTVSRVMFGAGMAGAIGWLFSLAKRRAAQLAGDL